MKTLKLGALALGMMVAGSAMAMDDNTLLVKEAKAAHQAALANRAQLAADEVNYLENEALPHVEQAMQTNNAMVLSLFKTQMQIFANKKAISQYSRFTSFIITHHKKLAFVAVVAAITAGVIAYKKYSAKKKKKIEVEETEDNIEEVTAE